MVTIEQQTGWKRPHPNTICQDHSILEKIYNFDYDLTRPGFLNFFEFELKLADNITNTTSFKREL